MGQGNAKGKLVRIPGLDGLRGIAALIVLLTHMSGWGYHIIPNFDLKGIGRSGVLLFFVLSSFLLTSQVLARDNKKLLSIRVWFSYAVSRIFRIWPLFLVVLLVSLVSSHLYDFPVLWRLGDVFREIPVPMSLGSFLDHVFLISGEDILWTIGVEFKFYLWLPFVLIFLLLLFKNEKLQSVLFLSFFVVVGFIFLPGPNGVDTLPFVSVFLTGVVLAFLIYGGDEEANIKQPAVVKYRVLGWICIGLYFSTIPALELFSAESFLYAGQQGTNIFFSVLWVVFIYSMLKGRGGLLRFLDSRALVFLGMISYSLYLWHRVPIKIIHRLEYYDLIGFVPEFVKPILIVLFSLLLAWLSYIAIEIPFQKLGAKIKLKIKESEKDYSSPHKTVI